MFCLCVCVLSGAEVCITYRGDILWEPQPIRQQILSIWGFTCACDRCKGKVAQHTDLLLEEGHVISTIQAAYTKLTNFSSNATAKMVTAWMDEADAFLASKELGPHHFFKLTIRRQYIQWISSFPARCLHVLKALVRSNAALLPHLEVEKLNLLNSLKKMLKIQGQSAAAADQQITALDPNYPTLALEQLMCAE